MRKLAGPITSIVSVIVSIVIAEVCLRLVAPVPDPYEEWRYRQSGPQLNQYIRSEFPRNYRAVTEAEPGLPGVEGRNVFSTNNMGYRGDYLAVPKPASEYRIFIIGGSTAETLYLDDEDALDSVLQGELSSSMSAEVVVKVYNAGHSGDATDDHISMLVHRIVHLEPDMIVLFAGVNDLSRSIYGNDYLHFVNSSPATREEAPIVGLLLTEFQIPRRLYYFRKKISPRTEKEILEEITFKSNYREHIELRESVPVSDQRPRTDFHSYENNLRTIIGVARAHGIELVLMTQQSTWNSSVDPEAKEWHWLLYRNGITYREDLMDEALESFNDVMRRLAAEYWVPLFDLAKSMPKSLEFFYDDVHFNVRGSQAAGRELALFILEKDLIP